MFISENMEIRIYYTVIGFNPFQPWPMGNLWSYQEVEAATGSGATNRDSQPYDIGRLSAGDGRGPKNRNMG